MILRDDLHASLIEEGLAHELFTNAMFRERVVHTSNMLDVFERSMKDCDIDERLRRLVINSTLYELIQSSRESRRLAKLATEWSKK